MIVCVGEAGIASDYARPQDHHAPAAKDSYADWTVDHATGDPVVNRRYLAGVSFAHVPLPVEGTYAVAGCQPRPGPSR